MSDPPSPFHFPPSSLRHVPPSCTLRRPPQFLSTWAGLPVAVNPPYILKTHILKTSYRHPPRTPSLCLQFPSPAVTPRDSTASTHGSQVHAARPLGPLQSIWRSAMKSETEGTFAAVLLGTKLTPFKGPTFVLRMRHS